MEGHCLKSTQQWFTYAFWVVQCSKHFHERLLFATQNLGKYEAPLSSFTWFMVSAQCITMDPAAVKSSFSGLIQRQCLSFVIHGTNSVCRSFIDDFSSIRCPITAYFRKGLYKWTPRAPRLKILMDCYALVVSDLDLYKHFEVAYEVYRFVISCTLSQEG